MADLLDALRAHTCFYASYDAGPDADVHRGDGAASLQSSVVAWEPNSGRSGGGLVFSAADYGWDEDECTYAATGNFPYSRDGFSGTVSMWLSCDPDEDLNPEFPVDPFHVSRRAADGSFYVDLTKPNDERYGSPRHLRLGIYNDSEENSRFVAGQLVVVGDLSWRRDQWHHVVATWRGANSGRADGLAEVWIDGVRRGWMEGYEHRVTWDIDELTIGLGQRFSGRIDEVLILETALDGGQIGDLSALSVAIADVL
jgi:hypothetical protein